MFSWMGGQSCKSACVGSDPTTDTVRFDHTQGLADTMAEQQQKCAERVEEEERERRRSEEARERRRLELEQLRRTEEERQRREALERKERERRAQEEKERVEIEQEKERLRLAEQQRQQDEETARVEAARREQLRLEQEDRARQEEQAAWEQLQVWLKKNGYASVNTKKSKMMKGRYPLHDATAQNDADVVRLLLRFGADATLKNTSGQTAQELAKKTKGCDAVTSVFAAPSQTRMGGA